MTKKKIIIIAIALIVVLALAFVFIFGKKGKSECEKLEEKIMKEIDDMNHCKAKTDCVLLNGCPYGCNNLINKDAEMKKFSELNSGYRDLCGECDSACSHALKPAEIDCVDKKCVSTRQ